MERPRQVLVVDDEPAILEAVTKVLEKEGVYAVTAPDGRAALERIRQQPIDVVLTDLRMPALDGQSLLKAIKAISPTTEVILMTAYGTVEVAVLAMKEGAYDFIAKPLKRAHVVSAVRKALEKVELLAENRDLRAALDAATLRTIVGHSQVMRATLEMARQAASSSATVLLLGESGTGKELLARFIHRHSPRTNAAFVPVNCAALPESILESELFGHEKGAFTGAIATRPGRFAEADRGTLFLDEIAEVTPSVQVKLLRALQEGEIEPVGGKRRAIDFRLVCATNRDLAKDVREGSFREDLFYRINVIPISIPPLRDRIEDIPLLCDHFLHLYATKHNKPGRRLSDAALDMLGRYTWPGNVRELENAIERAVVLCREATLDTGDLPPEIHSPHAPTGRTLTFGVGTPLEEIERRMIAETLKFTGGDKRLAADLLGVATRTIYRKLEADREHEGPATTATPTSEPASNEAEEPAARSSEEGIFH